MFFLSAGEVSGDVYGAELVKALLSQGAGPCFGLGGEHLQSAGQSSLANVLDYSAVGLTENLGHLGYFQKCFVRVKAWLRQCRPQFVVLVDFQGLNLKIGAYARTLNIPVFYFIAPQAWIWRAPGDLKRIVQSCDCILSVFKPEHDFYQQRGLNSVFVGHPLWDMLANHPLTEKQLSQDSRLFFWLPGSRRQEIQRLTAPLRQLMLSLPGSRHMIPVAREELKPLLKTAFGDLPVEFVSSQKRFEYMAQAHCVAGASGSAILEAALLKKPVVAMYRVSSLTYLVASQLINAPYVTLPNLLLKTPVVPEFLQNFPHHPMRQAILAPVSPLELQQRQQKLGLELGNSLPGTAAQRASGCILKYISQRKT